VPEDENFAGLKLGGLEKIEPHTLKRKREIIAIVI